MSTALSSVLGAIRSYALTERAFRDGKNNYGQYNVYQKYFCSVDKQILITWLEGYWCDTCMKKKPMRHLVTMAWPL